MKQEILKLIASRLGWLIAWNWLWLIAIAVFGLGACTTAPVSSRSSTGYDVHQQTRDQVRDAADFHRDARERATRGCAFTGQVC